MTNIGMTRRDITKQPASMAYRKTHEDFTGRHVWKFFCLMKMENDVQFGFLKLHSTDAAMS